MPATHTLSLPDVDVVYDVHGPLGPDVVPLLLIGAPMSAAGFPSLSAHFEDRTLVTYDPRGVERSVRTSDERETTPAQHAEDVHAVIEAVGGNVDLFASSGGAVNALALVAAHPEDVRTLVAHEPPAIAVLPDREAATAATDDLWDTYQCAGFFRAMAKFITLTSIQGELDGPVPDVDPAQFGMPDTDDGTREDPLLFQYARGMYSFVPDYDALRAAPTRMVIGVGTETGEAISARTAVAIAAGLGVEPTVFPSGHAGFLGGEFGQHGEPEAFAAVLRGVLDGE